MSRCPWLLPKQIICNLVLSCTTVVFLLKRLFCLYSIHVENLLGKICKFLILVSYITHDISRKRKLLIRHDMEVCSIIVADYPHPVWYQTSHCYIIMALRLVTFICLIVKGTGHNFCCSGKPINRFQKQENINIFQNK